MSVTGLLSRFLSKLSEGDRRLLIFALNLQLETPRVLSELEQRDQLEAQILKLIEYSADE